MSKGRSHRLNPFIAMTDVMISVILVFILTLAGVSIGSTSGKAIEQQQLERLNEQIEILSEVIDQIPKVLRPTLDVTRNDPTGTLRWRFEMGASFFEESSTELSLIGNWGVTLFGQALRDTLVWRRIRIEGHSPQTLLGEPEDWEGSVLRAVRVADVLTNTVGLPAWCIAVAGRGGQDPIQRGVYSPGVNDRVDIIVEFPINDLPCTAD